MPDGAAGNVFADAVVLGLGEADNGRAGVRFRSCWRHLHKDGAWLTELSSDETLATDAARAGALHEMVNNQNDDVI
jgi:hypothetical protein